MLWVLSCVAIINDGSSLVYECYRPLSLESASRQMPVFSCSDVDTRIRRGGVLRGRVYVGVARCDVRVRCEVPMSHKYRLVWVFRSKRMMLSVRRSEQVNVDYHEHKYGGLSV